VPERGLALEGRAGGGRWDGRELPGVCHLRADIECKLREMVC
jgi:hypothetical protein